MTENLKIASVAINKWTYFSLNYIVVPYTPPNDKDVIIYVPEFIVKVPWTCPISHMIGKWKAATRTEDAHSYIIRFYIELDSTNSALFIEWVMNNYNDEMKRFD